MTNKKGTIEFRLAKIDDLHLLEFWDEQPHVIACDPDDDWNWSIELQRFPAWRVQLVAELDGTPIGFVQIIDPTEEETHYWGKVPKNLRAIDIWIGEKKYLGKGYGTIMMNMALDRCFSESKVTAILIDPLETNTAAIRFYKRMGFHYIETRDFEGSTCVVMGLNRKDWKTRNNHDVRNDI